MVYMKWECNQPEFMYWCCENPHAVHEVSKHDLKIWSLVCSEYTQIHKGRGF